MEFTPDFSSSPSRLVRRGPGRALEEQPRPRLPSRRSSGPECSVASQDETSPGEFQTSGKTVSSHAVFI